MLSVVINISSIYGGKYETIEMSNIFDDVLKRVENHKITNPLPSTLTVHVVTASPISLTALHMYVPLSSP